MQRKISYHILSFRSIFSCGNLHYASAVFRQTRYLLDVYFDVTKKNNRVTEAANDSLNTNTIEKGRRNKKRKRPTLTQYITIMKNKASNADKKP